jgi:CPA2 family monovalent cation:H+ antiporter-2
MSELFLRETVVFLAATGLVIPLVKRYRISPVLGFLGVGALVGPFGLGRLVGDWPVLGLVVLTDLEGTRALAELGVIFLLFMIGLELSVERLVAMQRMVLGLGGTQVLVSTAVISLVAYGFGNSAAASVVLGSCLALSSTAIVMELLTEQGRFGTSVGQGTFSVLLAQDIAVVPILFIVGALGTSAGDGDLVVSLGLALGSALLAVVLILGVGKLVVRPLFQFVSTARSPELFVAATLLMIIVTASATHAAGLSAALGAFLAGLLFAETEFRHEIQVNIDPFKGLLLGLFFMSVGMGVDVGAVAAKPGLLALSVVGLLVLKAAIVFVLARRHGFAKRQALEIGLLLGHGGEFAFVVIGMALTLNIVPTATAQFMLILVSLSMLTTPLVARGARALAAHMEARDDSPEGVWEMLPATLENHVVIVGYGRTGQLLAGLLDRQGFVHVALDLDAARVAECRAFGAPVYFGDASRAAMLHRVALEQAAVLVISMDDPAKAERVLGAARRLVPGLPVVVRARDDAHALRLWQHGATQVVPEVLEAGLQMGMLTLEHAGMPAQAARELIEEQRELAIDALATLGKTQETGEK